MGTDTELHRLRAQRAELYTDMSKQDLVIESLDRPGYEARLDAAIVVQDDMARELRALDARIAQARA